MSENSEIEKIDFATQLLVDTLNDLKKERAFIRRLCFVLCGAIILLIGGIVFSSIYHQKKLFDFMQDIDINSAAVIDNDNSTNYGNITAK